MSYLGASPRRPPALPPPLGAPGSARPGLGRRERPTGGKSGKDNGLAGRVRRTLCPVMGHAAQGGTSSTRGAAPSRARRSEPCSSTLDGAAPLCGDGIQWAARPWMPTPQRNSGREQSGPIERTRTQQNIFYFVALGREVVKSFSLWFCGLQSIPLTHLHG